MPGPIQKASWLLSGGVDNRSERELVQPIAPQGTTVKLRASTNTRLSRRVGGVARSPSFVEVDNPLAEPVAGEPCFALLTAANGKATLAMRAPYHAEGSPIYADAGRVSPGNALSAPSGGSSTVQTSATTPRVVDAGSVGQYAAISNIATAYSATLDQVWTVYWGFSSSLYAVLFATVRSGDGTSVAGPTVAAGAQFLNVAVEATGIGYPLWCGITEHGANGFTIWYHQASDNTLYARRVTVNASGAIAGVGATTAAIVLPAYVTSSADPAYGIDVCSGGDDYAYVATTQTAAANDGLVIRWNVVANSFGAGYTFAGASLGAGQTAISSEVIRGTRYVACNFGSVTTNNTTVGCFLGGGGALTPLWTAVLAGQGTQGVGFLDTAYNGYNAGQDNPRTVHLIGIVSGSSAAGINFTAAPLDSWICRTLVRTCSVTAGSDSWTVSATVYSLPFRSLQTHVAQWSPVAGTTFPVFGTAPTYGKSTDAVGQVDYVDDPSIEFFTIRGPQFGLCPIARIGCVRGTLQAPARIQVQRRLQSKSLAIVGQRAFATYRQLADTSGIPSDQVDLGFQGSPGRYVVLDFSPTQLSVAHDKDGSVYVASALPYQWDGRDLFEVGGFLHTPHMSWATFGVGTLTGAFHGRVVFRVFDATGSAHRSRPSKITNITLAANAVALYADQAQSMSRQMPLQYYYLSEAAGKTEHLSAVKTYDYPAVRTVTASNPMVYTTEADATELAPQPPPPAWDFGIVGSRLWGIDAELRTRAFYSKLRVAGVGYEFHPALEVALPSGSGDGYAVREWAGFPVLLAERGVFQVSGDGPTNMVGGGGGSFSPPVKISDYGCTNTASVAVFPTGVIWQFNDRFVLLNANGVQLVPDFLCTEDVSAALVLTRYSEVLFFSASTAGARVYNYEYGRWTTWDSETLPDPVTQVSLLPYDPDTALVYSASTGITRRLECNTYSAAAHMTIETDWCLLGGDFQDHVELRDIVFSAVVNGPHGLEIDVYTDYNETASTPRSWSAAEIHALTVNGRYTVRVDPAQPNCRAVRLRVRDVVAAGDNTEGMGPRALTVSYQLNGALFEDSFLQNSHK